MIHSDSYNRETSAGLLKAMDTWQNFQKNNQHKNCFYKKKEKEDLEKRESIQQIKIPLLLPQPTDIIVYTLRIDIRLR